MSPAARVRRVRGRGVRPRPPGPRLRLVMLGVGIASSFLILLLSGALSVDTVREWIDGFGAAAPAVFVVTASLLTVLMFPGPLLAGAAGLLFGTALGTPVAIISATLGGSLAFLLARFVSGDAIEELAGPRMIALEAWVSRRGFVSVLYARIAPGMPYNLINYACGLTAISLLEFAVATAIGTAPRTFAYVALGGSFGNLGSPETIVAVAILVGMAIAGFALARRDLRRERAARAAGGASVSP